ncbi:MAG: hypothetical protein RLZZ399_1123 [Verrucomicrobiota bacterium]|jgi:hypothetical protein
MIKRTAPADREASQNSAGNSANPSAAEFPERDFYTRKLEQALGSRIEALTHPSILQAVEAHFRQHPEHAHDPQAIVSAACQAKKAQVNRERDRGGVRV